MAKIRPAGQQKTTTAPPKPRVPGRNNRGGRPGHGPGGGGLNNAQQRRRRNNRNPAEDPTVPPTNEQGLIDNGPNTDLADTVTTIATEDPSAYLQQELNQMHGGLTAGTGYDQWLNDYYNPNQTTNWNQYRVDHVAESPTFDQWVQTYQNPANAQFGYAHRPDAQRSLNPFEGGGSHWSWFD